MTTPDKRNNTRDRTRQQPDQLPETGIKKENENVAAAFEEASKDIEADPDLSIHSPNDDLDEEESARLGEDKTDLV
ncbi:MAG TPA: hypothetical protein VGD17_14860 [Chitinophagaceae bacterium]